MPVPTDQEILDSIKSGIQLVITEGQEFTIDTGQGARTFKRADLGKLMDLEAYYQRRVDRAARGGVRVQYGVPSRRR